MTETFQIDDEHQTAEEFLREILGEESAPAGEGRAPHGRRPAGQEASDTARRGLVVPPWIAASASMLVWGTGQLLTGRIALAIMFLSFEVLAVAIFYNLDRIWESLLRLANLYSVDPSHIQIALLIAGTLVPFVWFGGVLEAYEKAARHPWARVFSGPSVVPAAASAVVPGWGQILNNQLGKSMFFLAVGGIAGYLVGVALRWPELWSILDPGPPPVPGIDLPAIPLYATVAYCLIWLSAAVDAFRSARKMRGLA